MCGWHDGRPDSIADWRQNAMRGVLSQGCQARANSNRRASDEKSPMEFAGAEPCDRCRGAARLIAVVGRRVEFGLFVDLQPFNVGRIERMVAREMFPVGHPDDVGFRDVDGL